MQLREERMSPAFLKHHVDLGGGGFVVHEFSAPDTGDFHDHPFTLQIMVVKGSYVEEVAALDGSVQRFLRSRGDAFTIGSDHIHRIVELPDGPCATVALYGPWTQQPGFWRFETGKALRRQWDEAEFKPVSAGVRERAA